MRSKDVVIKKSKIQGRGVFANRNFKKGEVVLRWKPKALKASEAKKLPIKKRHYIYKTSEGKYSLMQPPEKYINHSCDANTTVRNYYDVATRDIKKGEEITSDYAREGSSTSFICNCDSKICGGFVRRFDFRK